MVTKMRSCLSFVLCAGIFWGTTTAGCAENVIISGGSLPIEAQAVGLTAEEDATQFAMAQAQEIVDGVRLTVTSYETRQKFRFSPSGGFSEVTVVAKPGYRLLFLYITVDNQTGADLHTAQVLDSMVRYGVEYAKEVQDTLLYQASEEKLSGGARKIGAGEKVEGCLLFVVPEEAEASAERIAIVFSGGQQVFECILRPEAAP